MTINSKTRKSIQIVVLLAVVLFSLGAYFLVHVNQRKEQLSKHNFRILSQISDNINAKVNNFDNNVTHVEERIVKEESAKAPKRSTQPKKSSKSVNLTLV